MAVLILGSRTYAPLSDVVAVDGDYCFGVTDVALTAESLGATRLPLEQDRKTLIAKAMEPDTEVVLYCAKDAVTKQMSEGMAGIMAMLTARDISYRVVESPFSGAVCQMLFDLRTAVNKAVAARIPAQKDLWLSKVLGYTAIVVDKRDEIERKLEEGYGYEVGNPELDARWCKWERTYRALCDGLKDAERVL